MFDSFKRLWPLYFELSCLLCLYAQLSPKERWLCKLSGLLATARRDLAAVFLHGQVFCGVYVWVSVVTSKLYVGSSIDFRKRAYAHVRCMRKEPRQHVHRFLRGFGKHLFVPVPLVSCPRGPLRHVEEAIIGQLQPGLNREWMPVAGDSRRSGSLLRPLKGRLLMRQRSRGRQDVPSGLCWATFVQGGLTMPSCSAALLFAYRMKLGSFALRLSPGAVHLSLRHGLQRMFDNSVVSVVGCDGLQQVQLSECWRVLSKPLSTPLVLHVHQLSAVGWRLWATDTLTGLIRLPCTRKDLYKLTQLSFVRLWHVALQWEKTAEKRKLLQLVAAACRKVHKVDLRLSLVLRVPFGLQSIHKELAQSVRAMLLSECTAHPAVVRLWLDSLRIVQTQGRSVEAVLGSFRRWCRDIDCSTEAEDSIARFVPRCGLQLPVGPHGGVAFRGDDPRLPAWLRCATSLHVKYIPAQAVDRRAVEELVEGLGALRRKAGLQTGVSEQLQHWVQTALLLRPSHDHHEGSVPMSDVRVARAVTQGSQGSLVGVPIDKNRILYFEDAAVYRRRLIEVFLHDTRHYNLVHQPAEQLLQQSVDACAQLKWDKLCPPSRKGQLGFAQCLPKDKDCSLSRPIVPNCSHPLARLFNMAARGLAYMLMNIRLNHYNLFTTQAFVSQLAACSDVVSDMLSSGEAQAAHISQSDVKDMYTEISHSEIESCVFELLERWQAGRKPAVLNVTKSGRRGVSPGYTCDTKHAASMRVATIVDVVLYELRHAFFHVGCKHILRQVIGVSMGSKGGPVLAWCVCMINEHRFHSSLGADARYIRIYRYFDDVWQLLLVPSGVADAQQWVASRVEALQTGCYPASLRLIENSLGPAAEMLSCSTVVAGHELFCVHRSKNQKYLQQGQAPRFACFLPYTSCHARRRFVLRNGIIGLLHRMHMDTLPKDVPLLLPALLSYDAELHLLQYPRYCLPSAFQKFLRHPKVSMGTNSRNWHALYDSFASCIRCGLAEE